MTEDIHYCQGTSIYTNSGKYAVPATSPCHKPCDDMEGMKDVDPKKTVRASFLISKLREKHGIGKQVHSKPQPLKYVCTEQGCVEPWGSVSNAKP